MLVLGSNVSVGQCLAENQLFDESVEDLAYVAGLSTVEAKGEFVEVALQPGFPFWPWHGHSIHPRCPEYHVFPR